MSIVGKKVKVVLRGDQTDITHFFAVGTVCVVEEAVKDDADEGSTHVLSCRAVDSVVFQFLPNRAVRYLNNKPVEV